MDTNDFIGSFAQENVSFSTQIVKTASVGENFWTALVFVESDRFVTADAAHGWEDCPGLPSCKVLAVTADNYSEHTSGLLASWLYDLFCNGFTGNCILAAPANMTAPDVDSYEEITPAGSEDPSNEGWYEYDVATATYNLSADTTVDATKKYYVKITTPGFIDAMNKAYEVLKPYAYHKTVCAGSATETRAEYAIALAKKCKQDEYLSGAPLLPQSDPTLQTGMYPQLKAANADAFMAWHSDSTHDSLKQHYCFERRSQSDTRAESSSESRMGSVFQNCRRQYGQCSSRDRQDHKRQSICCLLDSCVCHIHDKGSYCSNAYAAQLL